MHKNGYSFVSQGNKLFWLSQSDVIFYFIKSNFFLGEVSIAPDAWAEENKALSPFPPRLMADN